MITFAITRNILVMAAVKVEAQVNFKGVFAKVDDMIKTLYKDYTNTDNEAVREYIKTSIEGWEDYQENIILKTKK